MSYLAWTVYIWTTLNFQKKQNRVILFQLVFSCSCCLGPSWFLQTLQFFFPWKVKVRANQRTNLYYSMPNLFLKNAWAYLYHEVIMILTCSYNNDVHAGQTWVHHARAENTIRGNVNSIGKSADWEESKKNTKPRSNNWSMRGGGKGLPYSKVHNRHMYGSKDHSFVFTQQ